MSVQLRAGDVVEVLSSDRILATLAPDGTIDRMPFMPEMLEHCGQRYRISKVAHKTCDTAYKTGARWVDDCYHLEDLRCSGSAHGGCQATCSLFWKGAWLRKVDAVLAAAPATQVATGEVPAVIQDATRQKAAEGAPIRYSCQTTRLYDATRPLQWWDPRQYVQDLRSGNVPLRLFVRVLVLSWFRAMTRLPIAYRITTGLYDRVHRALMGRAAPMGGGLIPAAQPTPSGNLGLEPGEVVIVKSHLEIRNTLGPNNKNRGLWFDQEYVPFCGTERRVSHRVFRILDERSGEMTEMKNACIALEGVKCDAHYSLGRLFCPRAITAYWREVWLDRAPPRQNL